jgi:hypothetical protein
MDSTPVAAERAGANPERNRWLDVKVKLPDDPDGRQAAVALKGHLWPQALDAVTVPMGHPVRGKHLTGRLSRVQGFAAKAEHVQVVRLKIEGDVHLSPPCAHGIREVRRASWSQWFCHLEKLSRF